MYQDVGFYDFELAFQAMDRGDNFSYDGLRLLFDHLENYEEDTGEKIELDVIAICCEWTEHTLEDLKREYYLEADTMEKAQEMLEEKTTVAGITDDTIVFVAF